MKINIDFYSENSMGIMIDNLERKPFTEDWKNEIFWFAVFSLRQLSNLGDNPVTKILAGLLSDENTIKNLLVGKYEIAKASDLLYSLKFNATPGMDHKNGVDWVFNQSTAIWSSEKFKIPDYLLEAMDDTIINHKISLVNHQGNGNKSFHVEYPPFVFNLHGFGFLGLKVNYYAFHSIAGFLIFLGRRHNNQVDFNETIINVSKSVSSYYANNKISFDQPRIALDLMRNLGID